MPQDVTPLSYDVWHGTNQTFDAFDESFLGSANPNTASQAGFFFSCRADTAWDYANYAAQTMVQDQQAHEMKICDILERAERAGARGNHDASEALYLEAESLESNALQSDPGGARVLYCNLSLSNPLRVDGNSPQVIKDLGRVLRDAKDAGHDGVIIEGICDRKLTAGEPDDHIAVFSAASICVLEVIQHVEEEDMRPSF